MSCTWPIDRTCLPAADPEDAAAVIRQTHAEQLAVDVLWALSGRQFGACPEKVRPCPQPCLRDGIGSWLGGPGWYPMWDGANWRNVTCGCSGGGCDFAKPSIVHLAGPVNAVTEVIIGGVVQDPSTYSLEGDLLYRADGITWPSQDLGLPLHSPGTWSVTYLKGHPVPAGVALLTALLAKEFLAACSNGKCRLPRNVEQVTRQGISYRMVNTTDIYRSGFTGLSECDLWIASVNPNQLMQGPRVR